MRQSGGVPSWIVEPLGQTTNLHLKSATRFVLVSGAFSWLGHRIGVVVVDHLRVVKGRPEQVATARRRRNEADVVGGSAAPTVGRDTAPSETNVIC